MKIVYIGAGNLAWHLAEAFSDCGNNVIQIFDKEISAAKELAEKINSNYTSNIEELSNEADLYIISISDSAISELAVNEILKNIVNNKLVIHTSGSVDMKVLLNLSVNIGVFYPVSTFTKSKNVNFSEIFFCIEANSTKNLKTVNELANSISFKIKEMTSEQRSILHLAAVFACNFSNYMYSVAEKIMTENNLNFDLLIPLIEETTNKISILKPVDAQTGPAVRDDKFILEKHKEMLKNYPDLIKIYSFVSESIEKFTKQK
jgi:predicted short-subunit dehydrogenase-like oxidoreductase (DUF2520 family)